MTRKRFLSKKLRFEVLGRDRFRCQYCGGRPPDSRLEIDHIVAVSRGGSDHPTNLITACWDCNRWKGASSLCPPGMDPTFFELIERCEEATFHLSCFASEEVDA